MRTRRPAALFLISFAVLLVSFYLLIAWNPVNDAVIVPFTAGIARVSALVLNAFGEGVTVVGTRMSSSRFAVDVENGCNGVEAMLLLVSAVLAFPSRLRPKITGILIGFLLIQLLNLVRVVSLFWLGAHNPRLFQIFHTAIWQTVIVLSALTFFTLWSRRVAARRRTVEDAHP